MLICTNCHKTIESLATERENHNECDRPCYEEVEINVCPHCGALDSVVKASRCKICGDYFHAEDGYDYDFCDACADEYKTLDNAIKVGRECLVSVSGINEFVSYVLSPEKINEILIEHIRNNPPDESTIRDYCDGDIPWFEEWVKKNFSNDMNY